MNLRELDTMRGGSGALPRNAYSSATAPHPNPAVQAAPAAPSASNPRQVQTQAAARGAATARAPIAAPPQLNPRGPTLAQVDQARAARGQTGTIPRGLVDAARAQRTP